MSNNIQTSTPKNERRISAQGILKGLSRRYDRLVRPLTESFFPKPHYLEEETVQRVIGMHPYRKYVPQILGVLGILIFMISVAGFVIAAIAQHSTGEMIATAGFILAIFLGFESINDWIAYRQWEFILTNKRIILITPHPDRRGFADAIYLKRGKIQVLDTNFSHSPIWGFFQALTGSRDVMLSMGGYEFYEEGAKVKGGLRFPDVAQEDIKQLEELIFGG